MAISQITPECQGPRLRPRQPFAAPPEAIAKQSAARQKKQNIMRSRQFASRMPPRGRRISADAQSGLFDSFASPSSPHFTEWQCPRLLQSAKGRDCGPGNHLPPRRRRLRSNPPRGKKSKIWPLRNRRSSLAKTVSYGSVRQNVSTARWIVLICRFYRQSHSEKKVV